MTFQLDIFALTQELTMTQRRDTWQEGERGKNCGQRWSVARDGAGEARLER